jgi:hypothetical protein
VLELPTGQWAVTDKRHNALCSGCCHFEFACPQQHHDHSNAANKERNISIRDNSRDLR